MRALRRSPPPPRWPGWRGAGTSLSPWWFAVPAAAFLALAFVHGRVVASRLRAERAAAFYDLGLARLDNRWAGRGDAGERFLDQAHLYAGDLDVFGRGSLFELLCTARTRAGEETLAAWLRAPASRGDVRARQDAVRDLLPRLDLREDLALLATEVRDRVHAGSLSAWATAEPVLRSRLIPITAALLAGASVLSLGLWWAGLASPVAAAACLAAELAFALPLRARVRRVVSAVGAASAELGVLSHILTRLEHERFSSPRLLELGALLASDGVPPSRRIAQLRRRIDLLDARRNQLFLPFPACCCGAPSSRTPSSRGARRRGRPCRAGWRWSGSSRPSPPWPATRGRTPRTRFRTWSTRPAGRASRPTRWAIPSSRGSRACATTSASAANIRRRWSSAAPTCRGRARCCGPSASTRCWRSPERPCGRAG